MFLDDTACSLASINLTKFLRGDSGTAAQRGDYYGDTVLRRRRLPPRLQDLFLMAQGRSHRSLLSYPTKGHRAEQPTTVPLGLGYANLSSLLMQMGVPVRLELGRCDRLALTRDRIAARPTRPTPR
jgi:ribonucleoside-diphosphate reductase alpha chain